MRTECEKLKGRSRDICNGTAKLPLAVINANREKWGFTPLDAPGKPSSSQTTAVSAAPGCMTCGGGAGAAPSLVTKAVSFTMAMIRWAGSGFEVVPDEVAAERLSVCEGCPLNQNGWCSGCGCHLPEKAKLPKEACPAGKWLQHYPPTFRRFTAEPTRHLLYHLWPKHPDIWRWNLAELKQRIELFDGVRSIAVVTDGETATLKDVQREMEGVRVDNWIPLTNNPKEREGVTFLPLMNTLPHGENDVTFYAHGKGVRHDAESITLRWAEAQYRVCLDDWQSVRRGLEGFPMVGGFKRYGAFKLPKNHHWHYSGTFFWFRNQDVFAKSNWRYLQRSFFGCVEAWPANLFEAHEAGCLFGENAGDLYQRKEWEKVQPLLDQWGTAR